MATGPGDQRVDVRARARDRGLEAVGNELTEAVGNKRPDEDLRAATRQGGEHEPDGAVGDRIRQTLEDRIEDARPVGCLPRLEVLVPGEHEDSLGLGSRCANCLERSRPPGPTDVQAALARPDTARLRRAYTGTSAKAALATPSGGRAGFAGAAVLIHGEGNVPDPTTQAQVPLRGSAVPGDRTACRRTRVRRAPRLRPPIARRPCR